MKGILAIMGKGPMMGKGMPPKGGSMPDDEGSEMSPDSEGAEGEGGDEEQYAKLVIDAMKDGDDAGAAKALVSLVNCCNK